MRSDERGTTLIEVVFAVALFLIIGSSFVYAMTAVSKVSGNSNVQAKASITQSGLSALFQNDIRNAKAITQAGNGNLSVARTDGTCVAWNVDPTFGKITRSQASGAPAPQPKTFLQDELKSGGFILDGNTVMLTLSYTRNKYPAFRDTAPLTVASSNGGPCWS